MQSILSEWQQWDNSLVDSEVNFKCRTCQDLWKEKDGVGLQIGTGQGREILFLMHWIYL